MRLPSVLAAGAAVALVGTGIAIATASAEQSGSPSARSADSAGVIAACVDRRSGAMRLFRNGQCRDDEKVVRWSRAGAGVAGARGPAGPPGPAGPSAAFAFEPAPVSVVGLDPNPTVVASAENLPPGNYVLNFSAMAYSPSGPGVETLTCGVVVGDYVINRARVVGSNLEAAPLALTGAFLSGVASAGAPVEVRCSADHDVVVEQQTLTLVRVGELTIVTDDPCRRTDASPRARC